MALSSVKEATVRRPKADDRLRRASPGPFVARLRERARPKAPPRLCPEIDCVRNVLPRWVIAAAEKRAEATGSGADGALIYSDSITEQAYLSALAVSLGTSFEPLETISRRQCPLDDNQLIQAAAVGLLPLREGNELVWIIAPRHLTARYLAGPRQPLPSTLRSFRLTSSERLVQFVARHTQKALGRRAVDELRRSRPSLSNAPRPFGIGRLATVALVLALIAIFAVVPAAIDFFAAVLCTIFLAAAALRLLSVAFAPREPDRPRRMGDHALPVYTIICPLYRETGIVENLVAAIRALDYPPEKLDVKLVLEADDHETRRAIVRLDLGPPFTIITAPPFGPRTKPKALNAALPFARGSFTVVYDAEDVPEPDQLRRAFAAFRTAGDRLACLQASLTIDNPADSWLARMFTASYAGQFDALLPGLAALHLPFPLGGSSNHFRTAVLRQVGGWDPYNVTEDADLGIRLHRLGYRCAALSSATYEEAPARFRPWLRQRTRWYKGWMQTWLVHMRSPVRLVRELTVGGALAFQLFLACNVLAALVHPIFMAGLCYSLLALTPLQTFATMDSAPVFAATLLCGYISTIVLDLIGLKRRRLLAHAWVLVLTPLYWFLLSLAAWRALFQLIYAPQRWEKTEHGLARTSRLYEAGHQFN